MVDVFMRCNMSSGIWIMVLMSLGYKLNLTTYHSMHVPERSEVVWVMKSYSRAKAFRAAIPQIICAHEV